MKTNMYKVSIKIKKKNRNFELLEKRLKREDVTAFTAHMVILY